jgi:hypothetical protein
MPVTDYPALVYANAFAVLTAAVAAYNAAVAADQAASPQGPLAGCRPVDVNLGLLDDRATGRLQSRAGDAAATYPKVELHLGGGGQQRTSTPTFGLQAGQACDAIIPTTVTLTEVVTYGPEQVADAGTTAMEGYIDAQFSAAYPKLNAPGATAITCCRSFSRSSVRRDATGPAGGTQTSRVTTMSVDLQVHLLA